jgi:hypothetical protein
MRSIFRTKRSKIGTKNFEQERFFEQRNSEVPVTYGLFRAEGLGAAFASIRAFGKGDPPIRCELK